MSNMRPKQLLAYGHLEAFQLWAETQGFTREPTPPQAIYEVARLRKGKFVMKLWRNNAHAKHCFPSYGASTRLVRSWIERGRGEPRPPNARRILTRAQQLRRRIVSQFPDPS